MARPSSNDPAAAQDRYSTVAIVLHWAIALSLAFQLALGFAMPDGPSGFDEYQLHKSVGVTILLLTLVRLGWRLTHRPPPPAEAGLGGWLAKAVHTGFYLFLIAMPLTGWAIVSTSRIEVPTVLWGVLPWPHLPLSGGLHDAAEEAHELLAWLGVALFLLHVAGVIRHQLLLRDGLLKRMGPGGSAALAGLLALLVVAVYFATGMRVAGNAVASGAYQEAERIEAREDAAEATEEVAEESAEAAEEAAEEAEEAAEEAGLAEWAIQPGGRLGFAVTAGSDTYTGSFSDWSGAIRFDPDNPESADIRIEVRLASATVGDATMDAMMHGAEFFAAAANPTATWRSTAVRRTGPGRYSAGGTLSLKGASRPQAVSFTLSGEGLRRHVEGSASIDRTAFGVGTGDAAQGLAAPVALSFAFDAVGRKP
ncbi:MAG TPA: cytochrome b/b6 domain-containing protein [Croceibacterium sp.]|nr:cytochrome b/b6 domain-containing protein [Croceibacterium sp.]